jgi:hypothetical protein
MCDLQAGAAFDHSQTADCGKITHRELRRIAKDGFRIARAGLTGL